jgi:hypothetical protein
MDLNQAGTTNRPGPAGSHADRDGLHYVTAPMAYISPSMERAYSDLVDPSKSTTQVEVHQVRVYDARPVANSLSLEEEGFILQRRQAPTRLPLDPELMDANRSRRFDMPPINQAYWEELLPMLGAR